MSSVSPMSCWVKNMAAQRSVFVEFNPYPEELGTG